MPILDGSSAPFIDAIDQVGIAIQNASRRYLKVLKPVRVTQGKAFAELLPNERAFRLDVEIDFPTPVIGRQRKAIDLSPSVFRRDISGSSGSGGVHLAGPGKVPSGICRPQIPMFILN